jgi:hypothetical protein
MKKKATGTAPGVATTCAEIDAAIGKAKRYEAAGGAKILSADYVASRDTLRLELSTGATIELPRTMLPALGKLRARDLAQIEIGPAGATLWFQPADTGVDLNEVLIATIGAAALKTLGARSLGATSTRKKAAAARANGKRGGRPRLAA